MNRPQPTLRQLRHLVALADTGHFGKAAADCSVTQSTLSASLKELEATLSAVLVDRSRRKVVFTALGREIVSRARRLLADTDEIVRLAEAAQEPLTGELRLGVIPTISPFLLPPLLPKLRKRYPRLKLYLREDLTTRLVEQLEAGRLDLLLLALPCDCRNAATEVLFQDGFSVALPEGHGLSAQAALGAGDLATAPLLLLQDGHCLRDQALAACRLTERRGGDAYEATSLHTLVQMVDNGLGLTLLPDMAVKSGILNGTAVVSRPLDDAAAARQIGLAWRQGTAREEEFRLFGRELVALATV